VRILIDIGHPAHVHYFRNFIKIMEEKGHQFFIIAKNRNITYELLNYYKIPFIKRKDYPSSLIGKLVNIPLTDLYVIKQTRRFKPDILLGFSGTHIAHAGSVLRIPSIVIDDTDHATLAHLSYKSFASCILTPYSFLKDFGEKQIRFKGFTDLFYLHPQLFKPDTSVRKMLGVSSEESFAVLRFISWNASHDVGQNGITEECKIKLVEYLKEKKYKVFISSEGNISKELLQYQIKIPSEHIHSVLSEADLYIGESGTMATEAAVLGTPSFLLNGLDAGVFQELVKSGLLYHYKNTFGIIDNIDSVIKQSYLKEIHTAKRNDLLKENINVTSFLVWFIENYPDSVQIMKANPDCQNRFK